MSADPAAEPDATALACTLRDAALRVLAARGARNGAGVAYWPEITEHAPPRPLRLTHYPSSANNPHRVLVSIGDGLPVLHVAWANGAMLTFRKAGVAPTCVGWIRVVRFERGAWEAELRALAQSG